MDADELWTTQQIRDKVEWEGGWQAFYEWGGLRQRTGVSEVDIILDRLQVACGELEACTGALDSLLGG